MDEIKLLEGLMDAPWGTIGPRFLEANTCIASHFGVNYGLVVHSASAALEVILRGWNIGYGDEVIVAAASDPVDAMVTAAVGAVPVFADLCPETLTLTCENIAPHITARTRAVIADLPAGNPCDAEALAVCCRQAGLYLILNLDSSFGTMLRGKPIAQYADAAFVNMAQGKTVDVGLAGAIVTNTRENWDLFYAYHNCGRPFGEGSTLSFDAIIGGDFRIAEWQASLIPGRVACAEQAVREDRQKADTIAKTAGVTPVDLVPGGTSSCTGVLLRVDPVRPEDLTALKAAGYTVTSVYPPMYRQAFLTDPYFEKLTGRAVSPDTADYPVCVQAEQTIVCVKSV